MVKKLRFSDGRAARNQLLAGLTNDDFQRIKRHLTTIPIHPRQVLHKQGERLRHVYFPNSGVISMATCLADGAVVEAATVGDEGMVGVDAFFGDRVISPCETIVQVPVPHESAEMMDAAEFRRQVIEHPTFRDHIGRYVQTLNARILRLTACNARHGVNARCARWLLTAHDHMHGRDFHLSQEFLAVMLGVRRQSVSAVAKAFQTAGLIRYSHGDLSVVDRGGLEQAACECYGVLRTLYGPLKSGADRPVSDSRASI